MSLLIRSKFSSEEDGEEIGDCGKYWTLGIAAGKVVKSGSEVITLLIQMVKSSNSCSTNISPCRNVRGSGWILVLLANE